MSSAQQWILGTLVVMIIGRLVAAITAKQNPFEALLNVGLPAVISAAAGGLAVLAHKASTLRSVKSIAHHTVLSGSDHLRAHDLKHLGDRLLGDGILVYVVFAILISVVLWEIKVGLESRSQAPLGFGQWARYVGLGFAVPALFGAGALYIIYSRS